MLHTDGGVGEERAAMGRWSGVLWVLAAAIGAIGQALPGVPHDHQAVVWALVALSTAYGAACIAQWIPWHRAPIGAHLAAVLVAQPVLVLALWVTGGADSYMAPTLVLALLYAAYFLPGWMAWVGVGALVGSYATPLLYTDPARSEEVARAFAFAVVCVGLTLTLKHLKRRLVAAERRQHAMAHQDPLTGLANRRGFEAELARALAAAGDPGRGRRAGDRHERLALLLIDLDHFKAINDGFGHTAGDRVLREVAARVRGAVRPSDCVARIGGDEMAVVAGGAGAVGAERMAAAIGAAAGEVRAGPGAEPVSVTVSWALYPDDARDEAGLFAAADRELHVRKRARPSAVGAGGP